MVDLSNFDVSKVQVDSKDLLRSNCFHCQVGPINFFVPFGSLESFVTMCMRSGNNVSILFNSEDVIY